MGPTILTNRCDKYSHHGCDSTLKSRAYYDGQSPASRSVNVYDAQGRLKETTEFDANGNINARVVFAYDTSGKLIESSVREPGGTLRTKASFAYGADGRKTKLAEYDAAGTLVREESYDGRGNVVEVVPPGTPDPGRQVNRYDDRGNLTESVYYNEKGVAEVRKVMAYEFDSVGNWTKKVVSGCPVTKSRMRCQPLEATYRTITYY